jgi:hypothetical protein
VTNYDEAAELYVNSLSGWSSAEYTKDLWIGMYTSDYALFWFDYLAGYDVVFVELGLESHDSVRDIALGRGAAGVQGKDWGAIVTYMGVVNGPPFLVSGTELFDEMVMAYHAGANYVVVFNYARDPQTQVAFCILEDEHLLAIENFWNYVQRYPDKHGQTTGKVAFVLPANYGWGMRHLEDTMWGLWPADYRAPLIWQRLTDLLDKYGLELDIIYENDSFGYHSKYSIVYVWDSALT